jgi:hypothetical protein
VQRGNKLLPLKKIVDDALQLCVHQGNFRLGIFGFCFSQAKLLLYKLMVNNKKGMGYVVGHLSCFVYFNKEIFTGDVLIIDGISYCRNMLDFGQ